MTPTPTASPPGVEAPATETPAATPTETPTAPGDDDQFAAVPGIVDASNRGWPREVEGLNGVVTIQAPPQRIHTTSLGLDEVTLGLLSPSRVIAVGSATKNPDYSNVADLVADHPEVSRDPEAIAATEPELVLASPTQDEEFIDALERVEITVIQLELLDTPEGRIHTILLMGYLYGEEERALELADEVRDRYESLIATTHAAPEEDRSLVMYATFHSDTMRSSGTGSTEAGIMEAAGARCAACEAGLGRNETISMESILTINPDAIFISMVGDPAEEFRTVLLEAEVLSEVPAVRDGRVYIVPVALHNTLSYENVRGAEQLAAMLWPEAFPAEYADAPPPFSRP